MSAGPASATSQPVPRAALVAGIVLIAGAWATAIHAPFVYDDKIEVIGNPTIRAFTAFGAMATYNVSRPVLILTYAMNWAAGGLDPVGYHLVSIAIHLANVLLVRALLRHFTTDRVASATALLWGLHPMCVEGVTYITGRSDALCATFWLLASIAWLRGRARSTLVALGFALLTKELSVLLPAWLALLTPHRAATGAAARPAPGWRTAAAMLAMVGAGAAIRVAVMGWPHLEVARSPTEQALLQAMAWFRYVQLWLLPVGQSILHDPPPLSGWRLAAAGLLLMAWTGMIGALLTTRRSTGAAERRPGASAVGLAGLFAVAWLLPSSVVPLKESIAEHRAYLVGVPLLAMACAAAERRGWLNRAAAIGAAVLLALTVRTNARWASESALWGEAARLYPESADATYGYADALRFERRWSEAEAQYRAALERRPGDPNASINLAICRAEQGHEDEAHAIWLEVTRTHPRSCAAHDNLGAWARRYGTRREALDEYLSAFKWCPEDPDALLNLGDLFAERGDTAVARKYYRLYLQVLPWGAEADRVRSAL